MGPVKLLLGSETHQLIRRSAREIATASFVTFSGWFEVDMI